MSFRIRLFLILASITTLVVLLSMIVVNDRFKSSLNEQVGREFEYVHRRLDRFQKLSLENLITQAINVSQDPRLRGSIVTGDRQTINRAIDETYANYWTDLFWVLDPYGVVLARVDQPDQYGDTLVDLTVVDDARNGFDSGDLWLYKGKLYHVATALIRSGEIPVGMLLIGEEFNTHLTSRFAQLTGLELVFWQDSSLISTSKPLEPTEALKRAVLELSARRESYLDSAPSIPMNPQKPDSIAAPFVNFDVDDAPLAGAAFTLCDVRGQKLARGVVYRSISSELLQRRRIQQALLWVGLAAIIITFAAAYWISQRVTSPLQRLADSSARLGEGDLETAIHPEGHDEIGSLAIALEEMRVSLIQARSELISNERLSTIGRMASSIIHDFRQPISAIYGYIDLLTLPGMDQPSIEQYKESVFKQFDRMLGMINELLDFAKGEVKLNRQTVRLSEFLDEVRKVFDRDCQTRKIAIETQLHWNGYVSIDVGRLQRGIENIIRNAVQILQSGGRIYLGSRLEDGMVYLTITDTGPGIPPEILATLFEPFVSHGKSEGTGLGLAVAKRVVTQHGGELRVENAPDFGACFTLKLPIEV